MTTRIGGLLRRVRWRRLVLFGVPTVLLVTVALVGTGYALTKVPEPNDVSTEQATVIRYAEGSELARLGTDRVVVPLPEVSQAAQKAVLAAEDRGFYSEPGISPRGIARALLTNVRGGGDIQQGGSTITQQYAKNAFLLSDDGTAERTYTRKVKEVFLALKMTRQRSKEQILEDYLNTIYFGRGAYGIEAASKAYFGRAASARTLTPAQSAVLASSIRSPAGYEPTVHRERARERFAYVLDGMVAQGWLTPQGRAAARYPKVVAVRDGRAGTDLSGPDGHVVEAVLEELEVAGFTEDELDKGGLDVTTTLRRRAQDAAVEAVQEVADDRTGKGLQGALVSVAPGTGEVIAYYGGANGTGLDYAGGVVRAGGEEHVRQEPGSSFKPYVLAAALDRGISLNDRFDGNSPKEFEGLRRPIRNFGGDSFGRVDLIEATEDSVNTAYVELGLEVGLDRVAEVAHAAGIPEDVPLEEEQTGKPVPSISLGVYGVHVTDQAVGYATFANGGEAVTPFLVRAVERDGETVHKGATRRTRAFSEEVAADATYAMRQVVESGSGTRAQLDGFRPAAGKTGTTTDAKDVWFSGFTPQLSAAVWFGYGTPRTVEVDGEDATGGRVSSRVWKDYMDAALEGADEASFPPRAYVGSGSDDIGDSDSDSGTDDSGSDSGSDSGTDSGTDSGSEEQDQPAQPADPEPAEEPAQEPAQEPSQEPTEEPTVGPTTEAPAAPTEEPSERPSAAPTSEQPAQAPSPARASPAVPPARPSVVPPSRAPAPPTAG